MARDEEIKFNKEQLDEISNKYIEDAELIGMINDNFLKALSNIETNWTGEGEDIDKRDHDFTTIKKSLDIASKDLKEMSIYLSEKNNAFSENKYRESD